MVAADLFGAYTWSYTGPGSSFVTCLSQGAKNVLCLRNCACTIGGPHGLLHFESSKVSCGLSKNALLVRGLLVLPLNSRELPSGS